MSTREIADTLAARNIKPSAQRLAIMKYLMEYHNHPSAEEIYTSLHPDMPTLSRTTVYNTMKLLEENGAVMALGIESKNVRYDANMMPHAHFRCRKCGKIYDMPIPDSLAGCLHQSKDYRIENVMLYYSGVCKHCMND